MNKVKIGINNLNFHEKFNGNFWVKSLQRISYFQNRQAKGLETIVLTIIFTLSLK